MLEAVRSGSLEVLASPRLERGCGVKVFFTGRRGGGSEEPFDTLNLSFAVGDRADAVASNRHLVAEELGVPLRNWVMPRQVHGSGAREVGAAEAGSGSLGYDTALPDTDALFTTTGGLAIGVLTADCVPLVIVDPGGPAVAVVHAGWRGALAGIAGDVVEIFQERTGERRGLLALLGPHIGPCCFEVGNDVACAFADRFGRGTVVTDCGAARVDLGAAVRRDLDASGIRPENVYNSGKCTACSTGYFSHRRRSTCGRQAALAAIEGAGPGG